MNGKLYGTTSGGGGFKGYGTVFEISTTGAERVLYRFHGKDGAYPSQGLIAVKGTLYGTTDEGGDENARAAGQCSR